MVYYFKGSKTAQGANQDLELPVLYRVTGTAFSIVRVMLDQLKKRKNLCLILLYHSDTKRQKKVVMYFMYLK